MQHNEIIVISLSQAAGIKPKAITCLHACVLLSGKNNCFTTIFDTDSSKASINSIHNL